MGKKGFASVKARQRFFADSLQNMPHNSHTSNFEDDPKFMGFSDQEIGLIKRSEALAKKRKK